MTEIPEDIMAKAKAAHAQFADSRVKTNLGDIIACAIMDERERCARIAEMIPSTPLCPITNAKRGDPLYDSTDDTVCPMCGETGHDDGRKCVNSMGGGLAAAILMGRS